MIWMKKRKNARKRRKNLKKEDEKLHIGLMEATTTAHRLIVRSETAAEETVAAVSKKKLLNKISKESLYKKPRALATKMQSFTISDTGQLLPLAIIKGKGYGHYYSFTDKKPVRVPRRTEYFVMPWKDPDEDKYYYLYSHYVAASGLIIRVPKEEVILLGFN